MPLKHWRQKRSQYHELGLPNFELLKILILVYDCLLDALDHLESSHVRHLEVH
jgi:hypothetical protein